jgi:hypothetical protein
MYRRINIAWYRCLRPSKSRYDQRTLFLGPLVVVRIPSTAIRTTAALGMCNGLLNVRAPSAYGSYASAQLRQCTHRGSYDVLTEGQLEQPGILQAKNARRSLSPSQRL